MAKEIKGARFVLKRSGVPGETPTIPPNTDHTSGLWIDTDIYSGEMFLNVADSKMWFRNNSDTGLPTTEMVQLVPLNSGGTIDTSYLPGNYMGAMVYQGVWNASSGTTPSLTPEKGDYWIVSVSGNTDLDGHTDWQIGDFPIYNGSTWDKIDNSEPTIFASAVVYTHSYYTGLTNAEEALDFLLDEHDDLIQGTNINITSGTHNQTISVINSPSFSGSLSAAGITSSAGLTVNNGSTALNNNLSVSGTLQVTGATNLYNSLTSTSSIVANTLKTDTIIYFNTLGNRIESGGFGIRFYQASIGLSLEFSNTGIATSYSKLRYDVSKIIDNNLDMVNKEYMDNTIALHNVGLWSSGGTILNPYQIVAYDGGITEHFVGINVQNPTYNLHVIGDGYVSSGLTVGNNNHANNDKLLTLNTDNSWSFFQNGAPGLGNVGFGSDVDGGVFIIRAYNALPSSGDLIATFYGHSSISNVKLYYSGDQKFETTNTGISIIGSVNIGNDSAQIENTGSLTALRGLTNGQAVWITGQDVGGTTRTIFAGDPDGASQMMHAGTARIYTSATGGVINGDLTNTGGINLGTGGSGELILRGNRITIANYSATSTSGLNIGFSGTAAFGNYVVGVESNDNVTIQSLTIKGQNKTNSYTGGDVYLRAGESAAGSGGDLYLNGGNASTATTPGSGDIGGDVNIAAGGGYNGGDVHINAGVGTTNDGRVFVAGAQYGGAIMTQGYLTKAGTSAQTIVFGTTSNGGHGVTHAEYIGNIGKRIYKIKFHYQISILTSVTNIEWEIWKGTKWIGTFLTGVWNIGTHNGYIETTMSARSTTTSDTTFELQEDLVSPYYLHQNVSHDTGDQLYVLMDTTSSTWSAEFYNITIEAIDS